MMNTRFARDIRNWKLENGNSPVKKHIRISNFKFLTSLFIFLLFAGISFSQAYKEEFFEANKRYSEGDYENAAVMYETLVSEGFKSGNLFYNLGNTYFRTGKLGKSLVNYERALRYIPDDEDLSANISFIRSAMNASQPLDQLVWYEKVYEFINGLLNVKAWFVLSAISFISLCIMLIISLFKYSFRHTSYILSTVAGVLCCVSLLFFFKQYKELKSSEWGIIISPKIEVRYSPSYSGAVAFELSEGVKAMIIRRESNWVYIRLTRKNSGWIEAESIEKI